MSAHVSQHLVHSALTTYPAGDDGSQLSPGLTAHRRRTDLVPTIVMSRTERGAATPGSRHRSPGRAVSMSRIDMLSVPRQHGKHVTSVSVSPSKAGLAPHVVIKFNFALHVLMSFTKPISE